YESTRDMIAQLQGDDVPAEDVLRPMTCDVSVNSITVHVPFRTPTVEAETPSETPSEMMMGVDFVFSRDMTLALYVDTLGWAGCCANAHVSSVQSDIYLLNGCRLATGESAPYHFRFR